MNRADELVRRSFLTVAVLLLAWTTSVPAGVGHRQAESSSEPRPDLRPTVHPPLPVTLDQYWLVPAPGWTPGTAATRAAAVELGRAAKTLAEAKPKTPSPVIRPAGLAATPLRDYALYLKGLTELRDKRFDAARRTFASVRANQPVGALAERVRVAEGDALEAAGDAAGALAAYVSVGAPAVAAADELLLKIARTATAAGDRPRAIEAWQRLYYEFPATDAGATAARELASAPLEPLAAGSPRTAAEFERAERLFAARRHALAREGFERLLPVVAGDQAELVSLRLAECDYSLRRFRSAADRTRPMIATAARRAEALFYHAVSLRGLGEHAAYVSMIRRLVSEHPSSTWAEDGLDALASYYIIQNDDESGDGVFREQLQRYPAGRHGARAGWKVGWWAYKHGRFAEAADVFDRAAASFPRSDYRPSWLYWSARARERAGPAGAAVERYRLVLADYANSYYGRLSASRLKGLGVSADSALTLARWQVPPAAVASTVPTADVIAWLIHARLVDQALDEVAFAQKTWGRSPAIDATRAWLLNARGNLRPGISVMRQTYPHFLAAGGERLPEDIQRVIFPIDYWPLIKQSAAAHKLDPYLIAALVAQESTFDADARSVANAIGLMQIIPQTGRRWARKLGIRGFSTRSLTTPAVNVRIGTAYFADLVKRFGTVHYALAGYNAGDRRIARWMAERPDVPREEFIDDIPFPETQNYVKRILGTAEDYRRLYGGGH